MHLMPFAEKRSQDYRDRRFAPASPKQFAFQRPHFLEHCIGAPGLISFCVADGETNLRG
jgi:hypothetical protein